VLDHELQQLRSEKQRLCDQVDAEMKKQGLDTSVSRFYYHC
jgi:hypothetical protein